MCEFNLTINRLSECTNAITTHTAHFIEISCAIIPENGFSVVTLQGGASADAKVLVPGESMHELACR
jgi:hypothetical protein